MIQAYSCYKQADDQINQETIHCVSKNDTDVDTITSMHINRFRYFLAQILVSEYAIEW